MAKLGVKPGTTSLIQLVFIRDSSVTTGAGKTGLAYNTSSLTAYYARPGATATAITLVTQTVTGAYSSGGFVEVDATNWPGLYRLDVPDAAIATGVRSVAILLKGAANMEPCPLEIDLTSDANIVAINANATAALNLYHNTASMKLCTVTNAGFSPTTTQFETADVTEATADHLFNRLVIWRSGNLANGGADSQLGRVTAYALVSGRGRFTVTTQTEAPANADTFLIV